MSWRQQVATGLSAIVLLATIVVLEIHALAYDARSVELKLEPEDRSASQPMFASHANTTSWAKVSPRRLSQSLSLEIISPRDEGSLWDDGPIYDLSRGLDY